MSIKKILLPVDCSGTAGAAIRYGSAIATAIKAELHVLHLDDNWIPPGEEHGRRSRWDDLAERIKPPPYGVTAADRIARYAEAIQADMILMPARGYGILRQLFLGSVSMDVVRSSSRPVWFVKRRELTRASLLPHRRVLCGVQLGPSGRAVVKYAAGIAATLKADLVLLHVVQGIDEATLLRYGIDDIEGIASLTSAARDKVARLAANIDVPYETSVMIGDVADCLWRAARKHRADLVIVGRGGGLGNGTGRNVGNIVAWARCPVITYPDTVSPVAFGSIDTKREAPCLVRLPDGHICGTQGPLAPSLRFSTTDEAPPDGGQLGSYG